ncbi:hypothetical protein SLEP1_g14747 [Rubroshorea leprosula]|uniref:Uncharacterized protein n=1 Tax=Rubroshorea leprosula TaxID=152421 RepID=A0AAV5IU34_9ROSI|nr:hypothetical protein SLEP1_g14747 [Rubroshorea leprosula]
MLIGLLGDFGEKSRELASVLANFRSAVTVYGTVHRTNLEIFDHVEIDRNSIGIKSDLNDDFSLNLW